MNVSFERNRLTLGNKTLELEVRIREVDKYKDLVFVRLAHEDYADDDPNGERNILAIDTEGRVRWRIQKTPAAPIVRGKRVFNPYIGIDPNPKRENRLVEAYDGSGLCWKVDPETGEVSDSIFTR